MLVAFNFVDDEHKRMVKRIITQSRPQVHELSNLSESLYMASLRGSSLISILGTFSRFAVDVTIPPPGQLTFRNGASRPKRNAA